MADSANNRVVHWPQAVKRGPPVVGGNGQGKSPNHLNFPRHLSFDR
ncbi:unnamed protein product, partial [Rotaria sp. Silwood1]